MSVNVPYADILHACVMWYDSYTTGGAFHPPTQQATRRLNLLLEGIYNCYRVIACSQILSHFFNTLCIYHHIFAIPEDKNLEKSEKRNY